MTYDAFITMLSAKAFIGDAISQFMPVCCPSCPAGQLPLCRHCPDPNTSYGRGFFRDVLPWALAPTSHPRNCTSIAYARGGDGLQGLPGNDVVAAYLILLGVEAYRSEEAPRESVKLASITMPSLTTMSFSSSMKACAAISWTSGPLPASPRTC
jgi:hypothetical protein